VSLSALRRIIEIERPDVIEVGSPFLVPWLVMRAIRGKEIRTAGFYHSDLVRTYAEPLVPGRASAPVRVVTTNFARAYVRNLHRRFDLTVAASPAVSAELRALGVADVHCIPLGVDVEVFRPVDGDRGWLRTRLRVPEGRPIALFAGRFCAEKRLDVVIDATSRLPANRRPHLVFIGAGPNEAMLHGMARARGDMSILPFIRERTELARAYRGADVYLASGPGETFGLAIAEAMACGLPVVAVNRGASPDRVRGSNAATLYRDGSVDECADAIRRMLERLSPELRAAAAGHVAATCSWSLTFEKLLQLYRELVARARA
jgi:alpha-1,6-mannosyltransferase